MSFDPNKPVSLEKYNETLSSTYAMTYEHMKNDPMLSQEEFIQQASTMSEKYHDAIQEFQCAQGAKAESDVSVTEGIRSFESNGVQADTNTVDAAGISTTDITTVDSGVSEGDIDVGGSGGGVVDNDGDGVDAGMDV